MKVLVKKMFRPFLQHRLADGLALAGGIAYLAVALFLAHMRYPNLDEGSYLFKGYSFAVGTYEPFQAYGFWINKMPLSFLIWGWVQDLFGAGLRVGRYFAVLLGSLTVLGVWIAARRMANGWLAALAVWVLALNPSWTVLYSVAASQVLTIFMLTWMLVLVLGEKRPGWQIGLAAVLAGLMLLTRENMAFALPLLLLYVFWEHGWKKGLLALGLMSVVVVVGHAAYWPEIMGLWANWVPFPIPAFLYSPVGPSLPAAVETAETVSEAAPAVVATSAPLVTRLHSLSVSLRIYFIPLVGGLIGLLFWPKRDAWRSRSHLRAAVFLAAVFFTLALAHAWASLFSDYCIYCYSSYLAFFATAGLLFVAVTLGSWNRRPALPSKLAVCLLLLAACVAVFFSLFEQVGAGLLQLPVPRLREGRIVPGSARLWDLLANKFHLEYEAARMIAPPLIGLACAVLLLLVLYLLYRRFGRGRSPLGFMHMAAYAFLLLGMLLAPFLANSQGPIACETNVLAAYEEIGRQFAGLAPPGTPVYLDGRVADVPLLYAPGVVVLPPQVNDVFGYMDLPDTDWLLRNGFWNEAIALEWRDTAEVFVIAEDRLHNWDDEYILPQDLEQLQLPQAVSTCPVEDQLHLFHRK